MLKPFAIAMCLALPALAVHAQPKNDDAPQKQQSCARQADARNLEGDERKAFLKECRATNRSPKVLAQQEKMRNCNRTAGERKLTGDERKKFMKECLSA